MSGGDRQQSVKGRVVVMDAFDEVMFSLAMRGEFPGLRISEGFNEMYPPDRIRNLRTISDCVESSMAHLDIPLSSDADMGSVGRYIETPNRRQSQRITFHRSYWHFGFDRDANWAFKLPTLTEGMVSTSYPESESDRVRVVDKVWRILDRLTTNQVKIGFPRKGIVISESVGGQHWCGHHALEWCSCDPEYMLNGNCRPTDDWELPKDEWYRDLYDRVVAAYGPDFGKPEPPVPE